MLSFLENWWEIVNFAQLYGGGHGDASQSSDTPAPRMGDLGDQAMSMAAMEKAADFGALTLHVAERFEKRRVLKVVADVWIRKATDTVSAI